MSVLGTGLVLLFSKLANNASTFAAGHIYEMLEYYFFISVPIFLTALISKNLIFRVWIRFSVYYLALYLILLIISPNYCEFIPFCKETIFMFMVPVYFLISIILITVKSIQLRKKNLQ